MTDLSKAGMLRLFAVLGLTLIATTACTPVSMIPNGDSGHYRLAYGDDCFTEGRSLFETGGGRYSRMYVREGAGWCSFRLHHHPVDAPGIIAPFWGAEVLTPPSHGAVNLLIEGSKTVVLYQPEPGFRGRDRFVLRLQPGSGVYPVEITVDGPRSSWLEDGGMVYFARGASVLSPDAKAVLDRLGSEIAMARDTIDLIVVEGHTDSVGDEESNLRLSDRRAVAVRDYLMSHFGLDPDVFLLASYGESKPANPRTPTDGINRRTRVLVVTRNWP